jgi:hypothetical protein
MKCKRNTQLNKQEWLTPQAQIQLSTFSRNNTTTPHMKQISMKGQKKEKKIPPGQRQRPRQKRQTTLAARKSLHDVEQLLARQQVQNL